MVFLPTAPKTTPLNPSGDELHGAGKRTRLTGEERRAQLLEVARELFATHGFHHISMDEIALAAQVTKPVLYKHFPSKLDLYLAIIDDLSSALVRSAIQELASVKVPGPSTHTPDDLTPVVSPSLYASELRAPLDFLHIKAVIDAYVAFVHDTGLAASLLFESDVTRDEDMRDRIWEPNAAISRALAGHAHPEFNISPEQLIGLTDIVVSLGKHVATEMLHHAPKNLHLYAPATDQIAWFAWRGIAE